MVNDIDDALVLMYQQNLIFYMDRLSVCCIECHIRSQLKAYSPSQPQIFLGHQFDVVSNPGHILVRPAAEGLH